MFLERSRAFYFERCSRVASSNTRITKHFFSSERELRETFERNREKKRKEKKSKNKKRKQERMREPSYSRKLGRTNQAEFESELSREIRGVLFACPHFFLLEKSFVEAECVFLIENAMMTSSSWQLLREYVNYEKREIQIEKMEKEKRVRVVFEGKKQSADEKPSLKVVVLVYDGGGVCGGANVSEVHVNLFFCTRTRTRTRSWITRFQRDRSASSFSKFMAPLVLHFSKRTVRDERVLREIFPFRHRFYRTLLSRMVLGM